MIKNILSALSEISSVHYNYEDVLERYKADAVIKTSWVLAVILLIIKIFTASLITPNPLIYGNYITLNSNLYTIAVGMAILNLATVQWLLNRAQLINACVALIINALIIAVLLYVPNHPASFMIVAFTLPILASGVLFNVSAMIVMSVLSVLAMIMVSLLAQAGLTSNLIGNSNLVTQLVMVLGIITIDIVLIGIILQGFRTLVGRERVLNNDIHTLTRASKLISSTKSVDEALNRTLELVREELGYFQVQIFLREPETNLIILQAGTSRHNINVKSRRRISATESTVINRVINAGQRLKITRQDALELRNEFLPATQSELLVPIQHDENQWGVIDIQSSRLDAFDSTQQNLLQMIATQLALKLHDLNVIQEMNRLQNTQAGPARLDGYMSDTLITTPEQWQTFWRTNKQGTLGYDLLQGQLLSSTIVTPTMQQSIYDLQPHLTVDADQQILTMPISIRGHYLGMLEFRGNLDHPWNMSNIDLVNTIGQRFSLALDNLRLLENSQMAITREQITNQAISQFQQHNNMDALLAEAARSFQQVLGASATSIRLGLSDTPLANVKDQEQ